MTDRLTPGLLRDLADLCSVGNRVVTLTANGETTRFYPNKDLAYVLREEAARREAEPREAVEFDVARATKQVIARDFPELAKPEVAPDDEALIQNFKDGCLEYGGIDGNSVAAMRASEEALRRRIAELRADNAQLQFALEQSEMRYSEKETALAACRDKTIEECAATYEGCSDYSKGFIARSIRALNIREPQI